MVTPESEAAAAAAAAVVAAPASAADDDDGDMDDLNLEDELAKELSVLKQTSGKGGHGKGPAARKRFMSVASGCRVSHVDCAVPVLCLCCDCAVPVLCMCCDCECGAPSHELRAAHAS